MHEYAQTRLFAIQHFNKFTWIEFLSHSHHDVVVILAAEFQVHKVAGTEEQRYLALRASRLAQQFSRLRDRISLGTRALQLLKHDLLKRFPWSQLQQSMIQPQVDSGP